MYYKRGLTYNQAFFFGGAQKVCGRRSTDYNTPVNSVTQVELLLNSTVLAAGKLTELSILPFL